MVARATHGSIAMLLHTLYQCLCDQSINNLFQAILSFLKIRVEDHLNITEEQLVKIIKKRKNWSSPGINGIQNYCWKSLSQRSKYSIMFSSQRVQGRLQPNTKLVSCWAHCNVTENESVK